MKQLLALSNHFYDLYDLYDLFRCLEHFPKNTWVSTIHNSYFENSQRQSAIGIFDSKCKRESYRNTSMS